VFGVSILAIYISHVKCIEKMGKDEKLFPRILLANLGRGRHGGIYICDEHLFISYIHDYRHTYRNMYLHIHKYSGMYVLEYLYTHTRSK
jgi:hypothetical protein